jgi:hypothetical protein
MLARIRAHVREVVSQLQDCTCVENVARFRKLPRKEPKLTDHVVLQILFSGNQELFASPGDSHWETSPLSFVTGGMMGDGFFALHLRSVFLNNQSTIRYKGEESLGGRRYARYDYTMSSMTSGWTIHHGGASGVVAVRGSFWADPVTYDIRRLEFHAEEIPPELLYTDVATAIDYSRVHIGENDLLLPQSAELRTAGTQGEENRDLIEFTHCQGFSTESTVHFDAAGDPSPVAPSAAPLPNLAAMEGALPQGHRISVALSAPVDDRSAVGSLVEGKVVASVVVKNKVLVPEGALVTGRIRRLERYSDAGDYFIVALEFVHLEAPGAHFRFYANLQDIDRSAGAEMALDTTRIDQAAFGALDWSSLSSERIWTREVPGVGTFFVRGSHFSLPSGFKTFWNTQPYP